MKLLKICSLFLMLGAFLTVTAQEAPAPVKTDFYPLTKNAVWIYKTKGVTVKMKVGNSSPEGTKIETLVNDKSISTEVIQVKKDGIYRVAIADIKPSKPVLLLKLPPKSGDSWEVDTKLKEQPIKCKFEVKEEKVTVPAGSYVSYVVQGKNIDINGMSAGITTWYVEKIGIVKILLDFGGEKSQLELEKFEPGN